jgi:pilus assembly protein Flp/PilA
MREFLLNIAIFCRDRKGQDLIEYALMAGFLAVAVGAVFPAGIAPAISGIMGKVNSTLVATP